MSHLFKIAGQLAEEMVEHHLRCGAIRLDTDFIAEQSCDIAIKIDARLKAYGEVDYEDLVTKSFLEAELRKKSDMLRQYTPV